MDRIARARFQVIKVNRWSVALALLALLTLLVIPIGKYLPVGTFSSATVGQGVMLIGRDFSGKSQTDARAMLEEMAGRYKAPAEMARESRDANGISYVVPERNGYSLDVPTTLFRLTSATPGTTVEPALKEVPPTRKAADYPMSVIRQGNSGKKAVALLVNVDWGTMELAKMLPVLKKHGAKVTFFVSGRWADANKELLKMMAGDGHEIATHGYDLSAGPKALAKNGTLKLDIDRSVQSIQAITGLPVKFYAPHMSEISPVILQTAADLKLRTVLYSLDTVDWQDATSGPMILSTLGKAMPGDLVLLHPKPNTVKVLDQALLELQKKGLRPVTLSELLNPGPDAPTAALADPRE